MDLSGPVLPLLQSLFCLLTVTLVARLWTVESARSAQSLGRQASRGQVPPRPAPPVGPPRPPLYTLVRMQATAGLLGGIIQLLSAATKHDVGHLLRSPAGAASPSVAVLALLVSGMLVPAMFPRWWERHRTPLFAATRVLYFSLPHVRTPLGISHVFQALPSQGRFSKLRDLWLLTMGAKGLPLLLGPVFLPLPLLHHLAVSAFAVYRMRTSADMCLPPMLRHPTWQRRIRWVHMTAEMLPLVGPQPGTSQAGSSSSSSGIDGSSSNGGIKGMLDGSGGAAEDAGSLESCHVFMAFFQLVLVALSVLLTARLEASGIAAAGGSAPTAAAAAPSSDAGVGHGGHSAGRDGGGAWWRLGWLRRAAAEAEALVRHLADMLLGRSWSGVIQAACLSLLLSCLWNSALLMEHTRQLAVPPQLGSSAGA